MEVRSGFSHSSVPEIFVAGGGGVGFTRSACVGVNSGVGCATRREAASAAAAAMPRIEAFIGRGFYPDGDERVTSECEVRDPVSRIAFRLLK